MPTHGSSALTNSARNGEMKKQEALIAAVLAAGLTSQSGDPKETCPEIRMCGTTLKEFLEGRICDMENCPRKLAGLQNGGIRGNY